MSFPRSIDRGFFSEEFVSSLSHIHQFQYARQLFDAAASVSESYLAASAVRNSAMREDLSPQDCENLAEASLNFSHSSISDDLERAQSLLALYMSSGMKLHHPHYMGHQVPPPLPAAAAMDTLVSVMNQGLAINAMSPFASAIDRVLIRQLRRLIGWNDGQTSGLCTSGGTLANTTAILAARNHKYPDFWESGSSQQLRPALLTSEDSHYSISRSLGVLGLGTKSLIKVPVDAQRRMTAKSLRDSIEKTMRDGFDIFCAVASAPSTPAGSIDDISGIAEVCAEFGIWLHVDAVHGAPYLFSPALRQRLRGIDQADSVSWDAHKMMHVPSLCTFLLFKNLKQSFAAFDNRASYLFDDGLDEQAILDGGRRSFECTKRALSAPLWFVWSMYGESVFRTIAETTAQLALEICLLIQQRPSFELACQPDTNIVCFRFCPDRKQNDLPCLNQLQSRIHDQINRSRNFYITQTMLNEARFLRVSLMNPATKVEDFAALLDLIESIKPLEV
jgi:L-2,4-diaminobutyrate decarboxylase